MGAEGDDALLTDKRMIMNQIHAEASGYEHTKQRRAAAKTEP